MIVSGKTERRLRNVLITLTIICLTPLCERGRMLSGAHSVSAFEGQDITCVIDLGDEMYAGHGLETGMNYELLNRFAEDNRCNISIITPAKGENYIDSLKQGKVDIVIAHAHDLQDDKDSIEISRMMNSCSAWAVSKGSEAKFRDINLWIGYMTASPEFESLEKEIEKLETEKDSLTMQLSSGALSSDELLVISNRITEIMEQIDEKTMRWLELSEI